MTEQEPRDVIRGERAKTNRPFPKTFHEEMSEETPIPADRCRSKAPFLPEIGLVLLLEHRQRGSIYRQLWRWNGALGTQMFKEVMHGSCITVSETSRAAPRSQEAFDYLLQIDEYQPLPFEPLFQVIQEPQPFSHRRSGITTHIPHRRLKVRRPSGGMSSRSSSLR
jgi:hypothetical protein